MSDERFKGLMVKRPCIGCIYFAQCGSTTRTEKCYGRVTKSEKDPLITVSPHGQDCRTCVQDCQFIGCYMPNIRRCSGYIPTEENET